MEYKVGDKVRITGCCHGPQHMFKKAMVGEIMKWPRTGCWIIGVDGEGAQIVNEEDFEAFPVAGNISPKGKEDAYIYIKGGHAFLKFWDPHSSQELTGEIEDAHLFNLMSEEEFKAKHQPKLKFKEWEVKRYWDDKEELEMVSVGCEKFSVHELTVYYHMTQRIKKHTALREAWEFIDEHKEELGI